MADYLRRKSFTSFMTNVFRFLWNHPWLLLVLSLGLAAFTANKLLRMSEIRGESPGSETVVVSVIEKSTEIVRWRNQERAVYWLDWRNENSTEYLSGRINVPAEIWEETVTGNPLALVKIPGSNELFLKRGIYASDGNLETDRIFLGLELALAAAAAFRLVTLSMKKNQVRFHGSPQ